MAATRIVSGDFGGFLMVWDLENDVFPQLERHLDMFIEHTEKPFVPLFIDNHVSHYPHRGHVTAVHVSSTKIVSGSRDKTVVITNFWQ